MNKEMILKSDVLDILFENRNKVYGAYDLRKFYGRRLMRSMAIMIGVVMVLSAFTFLPEKKSFPTTTYIIDDHTMGNVPKPKVPEVKPKVKVTVHQAAPTVKWNSRITFVHKKDSADNLDHDISKLNIGSTTTIITKPGGPGTIIPVIPPGIPGTPTPVKPPVNRTTPVDHAEVMPEFLGGTQALLKFLQKNLQSPRDMESGEEVDVMIKFVVGYDGKLQHFEITRDGGPDFNNEVIRVLKKMPDWNPGRSQGEDVAVYFSLPVKFRPDE